MNAKPLVSLLALRGSDDGRRGDPASDDAVTARLERVRAELTPLPLPPPPARGDAHQWREQIPTSPGVPSAMPVRRQGTVPLAVEIEPPAPRRGRPPWLVPVLLALTALAVGMVLGALVIGGPHDATCASGADTRAR